jgi:hypothetical protein
VLAVLDDRGDGLAGLGRILDAPEGVVGDDGISTRVLNDVTSAIGTVRSRSAVLLTVVCTKSAMVGSSCLPGFPGI